MSTQQNTSMSSFTRRAKMSEVIIVTSDRILPSLDLALKLLTEADRERTGMRVYPDEYSRARNDLLMLIHKIKEET